MDQLTPAQLVDLQAAIAKKLAVEAVSKQKAKEELLKKANARIIELQKIINECVNEAEKLAKQFEPGDIYVSFEIGGTSVEFDTEYDGWSSSSY